MQRAVGAGRVLAAQQDEVAVEGRLGGGDPAAEAVVLTVDLVAAAGVGVADALGVGAELHDPAHLLELAVGDALGLEVRRQPEERPAEEQRDAPRNEGEAEAQFVP